MDEIFNAGLKLAEIRKKHKHSQEELANKMNITRSYLSKIETQKKRITTELIYKASEIYDVHPSYFLEATPIKPPAELKDKFKWIAFADRMEKRNLTPEEIEKALSFYEKVKKMSNDVE